jgi:hypothetical protein
MSLGYFSKTLDGLKSSIDIFKSAFLVLTVEPG